MALKIILLLVLVPIAVFLAAVFHRKSKYPEKTLYNCFLNIALAPMRAFRLGPYKQGSITIEKAMKQATKKTKLTDFGDTTFVKSYAAIANTATHKSLQFTNIGYIMGRMELNTSMVRRLKLIQYLKDVPEVVNVPVRSPVFVLGLPRTGTTFLHRLLSLDPAVRAPLLWELLSPVPSGDGKMTKTELENDREQRAKFIRKLIKSRKDAGDRALEHIHEIDADLPEECIMGLSDELPVHLSYFYAGYLNIKLYFTEMNFEKVVNAYKYYKKMLQILSYQIGETGKDGAAVRRWMLKCPLHMFYPQEIAAAFPGAKLIWTHRHPVSAVPSLCSLLKAVHQVYYENECRDDKAIGVAIRDLSADLLEKAPKDIAAGGLECSHVVYEELIANPKAIVQAIYKQQGWEFSPEYERLIDEYLEKNKQKRERVKAKHGKTDALHHYSPEEYGLTAQELCEGKFAEYVKKFKVPMSKN